MSKGRLQLAAARALADKIVAELAPACDRLVVAGSIRRGEVEVGDIEILCQPRPAANRSLGLLPGLADLDSSGWSIDPVLEQLVAAGRLSRLNNGRVHRRFEAVKTGAQVDLFVVTDPTTWGVQLAIRTGPADLSRQLVTRRCDGGLLPDHCEIRDGWRVYQDGARLELEDELAFLRLCQVEHLADPTARQKHRLAGLTAAEPLGRQ